MKNSAGNEVVEPIYWNVYRWRESISEVKTISERDYQNKIGMLS